MHRPAAVIVGARPILPGMRRVTPATCILLFDTALRDRIVAILSPPGDHSDV